MRLSDAIGLHGGSFLVLLPALGLVAVRAALHRRHSRASLSCALLSHRAVDFLHCVWLHVLFGGELCCEFCGLAGTGGACPPFSWGAAVPAFLKIGFDR